MLWSMAMARLTVASATLTVLWFAGCSSQPTVVGHVTGQQGSQQNTMVLLLRLRLHYGGFDGSQLLVTFAI